MIKTFKKGTIESKVFFIFTIVVLVWCMLLLNGCMSSIYKVRKEQIKITHVLAITEMGDTLKIPIEAIRPNVIYNVMGYGYNYMRPSYYRPYNATYDYYPYNFNNNNSSGNTFGISTIKPTTQINVPSNNNNSGTSGFSGKPIATNPVTSGGGTKKKN